MTASLDLTNSSWYGVSKAVGCGGPEKGSKTVTCMRSKTWQEIVSNSRTSIFFPRSDDKVVFSNYRERAAAGKFIKRVCLTSQNWVAKLELTFQ